MCRVRGLHSIKWRWGLVILTTSCLHLLETYLPGSQSQLSQDTELPPCWSWLAGTIAMNRNYENGNMDWIIFSNVAWSCKHHCYTQATPTLRLVFYAEGREHIWWCERYCHCWWWIWQGGGQVWTSSGDFFHQQHQYSSTARGGAGSFNKSILSQILQDAVKAGVAEWVT